MAAKKDAPSVVELPTDRTCFGKVIKAHRESARISQTDFADMVNVSRNSVANWEKDRCKPDHSLIPEICALLGIKLHELYGMEAENGLSEMEDRVIRFFRQLSPASQRVVEKMIYSMLNEELAEKDRVVRETFRLFLVRPGMAAAGVGEYVPDAPPSYTFLRKNTINEEADGIVKVHGDSMEPVYHSGDYVYYKNACSASPGEDVIVDTDDGAVIKRIGADRTLYSVNPDIPYPKKNEQNTLVIRGRVLGAVRSSERPGKDEEGALEEMFVDEIREFNREYGISNRD